MDSIKAFLSQAMEILLFSPDSNDLLNVWMIINEYIVNYIQYKL